VPYYEAAVAQHPDEPTLWQNLSVALSFRPGGRAAALSCARRAFALAPNNAEVARNLGSLLHHGEEYGEARKWLEKAYELDPGKWMSSFDLGLLNNAEGNYETAISFLKGAIELGPDDDRLRKALTMCIAHAKMGLGDYKSGLELYENRWIEITKSQVWDLGAPEWQGEDLTGKHLMVHHDQGDGDTIHFCRYLPFIKARRVSLAVPQRFMRLMGDSLLGIEVLDIAGDLPTPDYHSAVCSYLRFVDRSLPSWTEQYMFGKPQQHLPVRWPNDNGLRIGIVWSGRRTEEAAHRAVPLTDLLTLAEIPGVSLYSFQIDREGSAELQNTWASIFCRDFRPLIRDWQDTADLMSQMDLVISVDTAPLHLAGALAKPTICMLPYRTCWRWGLKSAEKTEWYPTMRLLRQHAPNDWTAPLWEMREMVKEALTLKRNRKARAA
jgi:tetratricopeptide (TPR) repeat protein